MEINKEEYDRLVRAARRGESIRRATNRWREKNRERVNAYARAQYWKRKANEQNSNR